MTRQAGCEYIVHIRVRMNRKYDCDVFPGQDRQQRFDDIENTIAKILAAMTGHQDDTAIAMMLLDVVPAGRKARVGFDHGLCKDQGVNNRISGDVDSLLGTFSDCSALAARSVGAKC